MNRHKAAQTQVFTFILASTIWAGCASHNVNPHAARPHTGYVDIFDPEGREFSWDIHDARQQRSLYTEYEPQGGIVRLALSPGPYQLKINILNTVVSKPATIEAQAVDGQVTPVRIQLADEGSTEVERKHSQVPGRYLRRTKITGDENQSFRLEAQVLPSIPYCPKEQVPYALK